MNILTHPFPRLPFLTSQTSQKQRKSRKHILLTYTYIKHIAVMGCTSFAPFLHFFSFIIPSFQNDHDFQFKMLLEAHHNMTLLLCMIFLYSNSGAT